MQVGDDRAGCGGGAGGQPAREHRGAFSGDDDLEELVGAQGLGGDTSLGPGGPAFTGLPFLPSTGSSARPLHPILPWSGIQGARISSYTSSKT